MKNRGFSLIELMVVISIIATLTAILLPNFMGARERAADARKIQDLESMKNALRSYYNDNQSYPAGVGVTLGAAMTQYMPGASTIDYTYSYYSQNAGEAFNICVNLDAGQGNEDTASQVRCGAMLSGVCNMGVGITADKLYVVCAR